MPKKWLICWSLIALGVRLGCFFFYFPPQPDPDSAQYDHLGENLLRGNGYYRSAVPQSPDDPGWRNTFPDLTRTPVYPAFVTVVYFLGGRDPNLVVLAQCVFSAALAPLLALLGFALAGRRAGHAAALLGCVDPYTLSIANTLLSESVFTVLLVASAYCLHRALDSASKGRAALAGLVFGLTALTRPIGLPLCFAGVVPALFWPRGSLGRRLRQVLIAFLFCTLTTVPWILRNASYGYPGLSALVGYNLLARTVEHTAETDRDPMTQHIKRLARQTYRKVSHRKGEETWWTRIETLTRVDQRLRGQGFSRVERESRYLAIAKQNLMAAPGSYLYGVWTDWGRFFLEWPLPHPGRLQARPPASPALWLLCLVYPAFLYALAIRGALRAPRRREALLLVGLLVLVFSVLTAALIPVHPRLRAPVLPFLFLLAALGLTRR